MKNYCTLGDVKYLPNLICLIDSIHKNFKHDYKIHVLALDDKVYNFIKKNRSNKNVVVYQLKQIEEDFDIKAIKFLPPGNEAISNANSSGKNPQFVQFCWALAPCFSNWLMKRIKNSVTYVDADILFYSDLNSFFSELGNKSIGLVRHRIPYLYTSGEFNVGMVHFENDGPGRSALNFWCNVMKNPSNSYQPGFGTCGDQKYLEMVNSIYAKHVKIIDEGFGHLAPWNVTQHEYDNEKIIWKDKKQNLVYFHFAHFVIENQESYRASYKNEWIWGDPLKVNSFVKNLYNDYFLKMKSAIKEIES